jgi:thiol-disulfide isomerase/thioredoxin
MMMNKRSFFLTCLAIAVIFGGMGAYLRLQDLQAAPVPDSPLVKLLNSSVQDSLGKTQALKQWQGKVLVINFWATWCAPCVQEMPELEALQNELHGKNVQLLGFGIDSQKNIADFAAKYAIHYPLFVAGMDGSELSRQLGNQSGGLPFTVLIDSQGKLIKSYLGRLKIDELRADITKLTI